MLTKKTVVKSLFILTSGLLANSVFAADLTIVNNSNRDTTLVANNGACSTILGPHGVTKAHSTNVVPSSMVNFACLRNRENCLADVYTTNNCTGPIVAKATFSTTTGIKSIQLFDKSFTVKASGFSINISGGPALAAK